MIYYHTLRKSDLFDGSTIEKVDAEDPFNQSSLKYLKEYDRSEIVAIIATDNGRLVGRIFLAYADVMVNGRLLRCTVGENLYVQESYRKKAVGLKLLKNAINLGNPYIAASVSADLYPVLEVSKWFHRIDASPVYLLGLDIGGTFRVARLALQEEEKRLKRVTTKIHLLSVLARKLFSLYRMRLPGRKQLKVLTPELALIRLESMVILRDKKTYIPWNRSVITNSLFGKDHKRHSWVVALEVGSITCYHFVSLYMDQQNLSLIHSQDIRRIQIARLSEVFPPITNVHVGHRVLEFAAERARHLGASLLFVYAIEDILNQACQKMELDTLLDKRIFLSPGELDDELSSIITKPHNWWCRGINESQFEEAYQTSTASRELTRSERLL